MKCDELKVYHCNEWHNEHTEFYLKYDVDASIDELKSAHHKESHEYINMIAELKQKLEDAQASAYADSVDAGMRERRLQRALWLARSERAFSERRRYCAMAAFEKIENNALRIKWCEIQHKCLKKAEEYR